MYFVKPYLPWVNNSLDLCDRKGGPQAGHIDCNPGELASNAESPASPRPTESEPAC